MLTADVAKPFYWMFFIYLVIASCISLINNNWESFTWGWRYHLPSILLFGASFLSFNYLISRGDFFKSLFIVRWVLLLNVIATIAGYFGLIPIFEGDAERFEGFLVNPNRAGFSFVALLIIELYLFTQQKLKTPFLSIGVILFAIFITFSKAAYVMTIGAVGVFIYYSKNLAGAKVVRRLIVVGGILSFFAIQILPGYLELTELQFERIEQFTNFLSGDFGEETTTNRSLFFQIGLGKIQDSWLLGEGFDTFYNMGPYVGGVHNQYLLMVGEAGIFALFAYFAYLVWLFKSSFEKFGHFALVIKSFVIIVAMYSMTNHNMLSNKLVMVFLGFITSYLLNNNHVRNFGLARQ